MNLYAQLFAQAGFVIAQNLGKRFKLVFVNTLTRTYVELSHGHLEPDPGDLSPRERGRVPLQRE